MTIKITWKGVFKTVLLMLLLGVIYLQQSQTAYLYAVIQENQKQQAKVNLMFGAYIQQLMEHAGNPLPAPEKQKDTRSNEQKRNDYLQDQLNGNSRYTL